jgi:hypothetical protein
MDPPKLPLLVLISGKPGAGKSTLAQCLAAEDAHWLPLIVVAVAPMFAQRFNPKTAGTDAHAVTSPDNPGTRYLDRWFTVCGQEYPSVYAGPAVWTDAL